MEHQRLRSSILGLYPCALQHYVRPTIDLPEKPNPDGFSGSVLACHQALRLDATSWSDSVLCESHRLDSYRHSRLHGSLRRYSLHVWPSYQHAQLLSAARGRRYCGIAHRMVHIGLCHQLILLVTRRVSYRKFWWASTFGTCLPFLLHGDILHASNHAKHAHRHYEWHFWQSRGKSRCLCNEDQVKASGWLRGVLLGQ